MSKASFMLGFITGVTSVGGVAQKEPVAYLYNGVRLPKLPEWDKTAYPYAFIRAVADYGLYELYVFKTEPTWFKVNIVWNYYGVEDGNTHMKASHYVGHSEHWDYSAAILGQSALTEKTSGGYVTNSHFNQIFWANFDVLDENGAVVLYKSDPIPVYE